MNPRLLWCYVAAAALATQCTPACAQAAEAATTGAPAAVVDTASPSPSPSPAANGTDDTIPACRTRGICTRNEHCCSGERCRYIRQSTGFGRCDKVLTDYTKFYFIAGALPLFSCICLYGSFRLCGLSGSRRCCESEAAYARRMRRLQEAQDEHRERARSAAYYTDSQRHADDASVASSTPYADIDEAPAHMVCPISLCVMKNPFTCVDGCHNFEGSYLRRHLAKNTAVCPVSREAMSIDDAKPNRALKAEIRVWLRANAAPGLVSDSEGEDDGGKKEVPVSGGGEKQREPDHVACTTVDIIVSKNEPIAG
eukprot:Rhum_TRINITY_DN10134_c0_g1::Rhum_TRINITY_DN10134_c0_g1_i1::g.36995::m.36995